MVASYTWGKDADRFDGLSNDEVPTLPTVLFVTDATRRDATRRDGEIGWGLYYKTFYDGNLWISAIS
jgi:hypothetical protein